MNCMLNIGLFLMLNLLIQYLVVDIEVLVVVEVLVVAAVVVVFKVVVLVLMMVTGNFR